jgi:hypothetical protein
MLLKMAGPVILMLPRYESKVRGVKNEIPMVDHSFIDKTGSLTRLPFR